MRRIRHFGDFVNVPLAIVIFVDLAGMYRLYLILLGRPPWRDRTTFWPHRTSILNRGGVITPRYARAEFFCWRECASDTGAPFRRAGSSLFFDKWSYRSVQARSRRQDARTNVYTLRRFSHGLNPPRLGFCNGRGQTVVNWSTLA